VCDEAIDFGNPPIANQVTIVALDDKTVDLFSSATSTSTSTVWWTS